MTARNVFAIVVAGLLAAVVATPVVAQETQVQRLPGQPTQARQNPGQQNPGQPQQAMPNQGQMGQRLQVNKPVIGNESNTADSEIVSCLIVDNQGEITLGKLAQDRAKDKDVKEFGEKMVKDHTEFMQKLEKFASANVAGAQSAKD